jgi:thiamine kinase-like enzyme
VLIKSGVIYPVDWESSAAAPGEMDLASLIEHWDKISIAGAKEAYQNARWPNGNFSKKDFEQTLMICRIHLFFRWCPFRMDKSAWIKNEKMFSYLVQLCQEAEVCFGKKIAMAN